MAAFDYELDRERLKRRRAVSDAMLAQSMQSMGGTEFVGGMAVKRSPLEGLAKMGQAYFAKQRGEQIDADERGLADRNRADIASAIGDYTKATTARPEAWSGEAGTEDELYTPGFTPSAQDKQTAAMSLMGKVGDPRDAAKMMVADALKPKEIKAFKPGDVLYQDGQQVGSIAKPAEPFTLAPGARRYGPDNKEIVAAPATVQPTEIARLTAERDALPQGDPRRQTYDDAIRKATTHQPAASANVTVNTEKQFLGQIGENLGKDVSTATANAKAAVGTINTVGQIREALDSGQVVAGPGTTPQMVLMQIGQRLAPGGDPNQQLVKTRSAIQGLAQLELDAAGQMKGQGQITEGERDIIRRAASGNIDSLTVPELRVLTDTLDKTARYKIRTNAANVQRLRNNPSAGSMVEFMTVDEPPPYAPQQRAPAGPAGGANGLSPAERQELEQLRQRLRPNG